MTRKMSKKGALFQSVIALLLCFSMLIGTTFAWFTDEVSSVGNKIQSGSLKVDLELLDEDTKEWRSIKESKEPLFTYDKWEPGYTDVTILKIENEGSLALKWMAQFVSAEKLSILADVIDVYVNPSATELSYPEERTVLEGWQNVGNLTKFINTLSETTYGYLEAEEEAYLGIALHMQETAGNEYQGLILGDFDIKVLATQNTSESDSFGSDYDGEANLMELFPGFDVSNKTSDTEDVTITSEDGKASIEIPAGAVGEKKVTFSITEGELGSYTIDASATDDKAVDVGSTSVQTATYDIKLMDEDGNVLSTTDDKPFTITMFVGTGLHAVPVYHEGALISGTTYDPVTGYVTFQTTSFSEYQFKNVTFKYSGEYFNFTQESVAIYDVSELNGLVGNSAYKATYNADGAMTDSVLTLPGVGNYILYSTVKDYGAYTHLAVQVPEGSRVLLYNVSLAPLNGRDAINIVPSSATNTDARTTYILLADNTNNHLDGRYDPNRPVTGTQYGATMGTSGRSGIGFGGGYGHEYEGELVISGPKGAIYCDGAYNCPGIGGNRWDCGAFDITLKDIRFVHTYGGDNGAGIGSSQGVSNSWGNCGDIIVDLGAGNYMDAKSGGNAASVGAGGNGSCDDIYFLSGNTGCWIGHYASWTSVGRCTWSSQTGNIIFVNGSVNDAGGGIDAGPNKIYFTAANEAEAKATVWKNWSGPIKSSKENVVYGYKGVPTSLTVEGLQESYAVGDTLNLTVKANYSYGSKTLSAGEYTITGADMSTIGAKLITISYTENDKTVETTLQTKVVAVTGIYAEAKTEKVKLGTTVDTNNFKVYATSNDGSIVEVNGFQVSGLNANAAGTQSAIITYGDYTTTCNITFVDVPDKLTQNMTVKFWNGMNFTFGNLAWREFPINKEGNEVFEGTLGETATYTYNGDNHITAPGYYPSTMSGYNNMTVTNAQKSTWVGVNGNIGFDKKVVEVGYCYDDNLLTYVGYSDESHLIQQWSATGSDPAAVGYWVMYGIYTQLDAFELNDPNEHKISWLVKFEDGSMIKMSEWTFKMAEVSGDMYEETDKPNANVIILAGQSNATGHAPLTQAIKDNAANYDFSNIYIHYKTSQTMPEDFTHAKQSNIGFDQYVPGMSGWVNPNAVDAEYFGPELGLAEYISTSGLNGERWYIIKYSVCGSGLASDWLGSKNYAQDMLNFVNDAVSELSKTYDVKITSFMWMQGETDAMNQNAANAYAANEQALISMVRTKFAKYATRMNNEPGSGITFVDMQIATKDHGRYWEYAQTVNQAKYNNCSNWVTGYYGQAGSLTPGAGWGTNANGAIANSLYVETVGYTYKWEATNEHAQYAVVGDTVDTDHYSAASMLSIGADKFGIGFEYMYNLYK